MGDGLNATIGIYDENGMTLLAGSKISEDVTDSYTGISNRDDLIDELCEKTDKGLILKENHTFTSPSGAAMFGIGRNTNGWTKWKNKEGKTLDEVIRAF